MSICYSLTLSRNPDGILLARSNLLTGLVRPLHIATKILSSTGFHQMLEQVPLQSPDFNDPTGKPQEVCIRFFDCRPPFSNSSSPRLGANALPFQRRPGGGTPVSG